MAITSKVLVDTSEFTDYEETDESIGYTGYRRQWKPGTPAANAATLETGMDAALVSLRTYIGTANPTAAQTAATVKVLCRAMIMLVRLSLRRFDSTD